ncbi:hypothetical protein [Neisseria shayeganii]|uniref:Uncharacterized protein n=1 Tax=Neisseria shayeganii TaxID=607712 RepID=A0A7D7N8S5_9NEIS|nr:hypothetical protein [Neisseria shayeganii]QMT41381.1 hypothetical protein H3L94_04980 [Neisseria shayeganii]
MSQFRLVEAEAKGFGTVFTLAGQDGKPILDFARVEIKQKAPGIFAVTTTTYVTHEQADEALRDVAEYMADVTDGKLSCCIERDPRLKDKVSAKDKEPFLKAIKRNTRNTLG